MQKNLSVKLFTVLFLLSNFLYTKASAEEYQNGFEKLIEKAKDINQKLDFKVIINALFSDMLSFSKLITGAFCVCLGIILLSSVFNILKTSFGKSGDITECLTSSVIILYSYRVFELCFDKVHSHISSLCGLMLSFVPIQTALLASGGSGLTSAALSTTGSFSISVIELISCSIAIPVIKVIFTVSTINVLCKDMNFTGITNTLKSVILWIIGLSFTLLSAVFALQTSLNIAADTIAVKGMRFGAARLIPIAGGLVSESLRTVLSSVGYIKSITGVSGIILIIYSVLPPIAAIIITKLFFSLLSAVSKITCCKISFFLDSAVNCLNILLALLLGCTTAFIIMLTLFIKTTVLL